MGGKLAVDTELGRGSTFSFSLPFVLPEEGGEAAAPPTRLGRPLRVLIVDPSDTSAETVDRYLRAWGMVTTRVGTCAARERFSAAAAADRYDVAILASLGRRRRGRALAPPCMRKRAAQALRDRAARHRRATARGRGGAPPSFDAVVGKPVKQSRLYDALAASRPATARWRPRAAAEPAGQLDGAASSDRRGQSGQPAGPYASGAAAGHHRRRVNNGEEVMDALEGKTLRRDAHGLPDAGHRWLCRHARDPRARGQGEARMPIVAVTANAMREDFDRCRESGMDDFVAKPVTLTALATPSSGRSCARRTRRAGPRRAARRAGRRRRPGGAGFTAG